MTKESILNKHDTSRKYIEQTCRPELFAAMDEYAMIIGVKFSDWLIKEGYFPDKDSFGRWRSISTKYKISWSTQFLYNQFIEQQQNK